MCCVLPTSSSSSQPADPDPSEGGGAVGPRADDVAGPTDEALEPIGPERLARLREAIQNGTYPAESDVVGGLVRMFREPTRAE